MSQRQRGYPRTAKRRARGSAMAGARSRGRGYKGRASGPTIPAAGKTACGARIATDSSRPTMARRSSSRIQGYSIDQATPTVRRAIVAAVWFRAQDERYRWLNYHVCIGEGEIDETTEVWWFNINAAVNEVAVAPPKLAWAKPAWA